MHYGGQEIAEKHAKRKKIKWRILAFTDNSSIILAPLHKDFLLFEDCVEAYMSNGEIVSTMSPKDA